MWKQIRAFFGGSKFEKTGECRFGGGKLVTLEADGKKVMVRMKRTVTRGKVVSVPTAWRVLRSA